MGLVAPTKRVERHLVYAIEKVGKTTAWMSIAEKVDSGFWIADSDNAYWANVEEFPTMDTDRHEVEVPLEWSDYVTWADNVLDGANGGDWVVIDRLDHMRDAAVNNYIERVFEQDAAEWYLAATQERKKKIAEKKDNNERGGAAPILEQHDWQVINGYYYSLLNRLNARLRAQHLFLSASAKDLIKTGPFVSKRLTTKYGEVGAVPEGGSKLGPIPSTILYIKQVGKKRYITTVGDRGRDRVDGKRLKDSLLNDFAIDYLVKVAGWRMAA